MAVSIAEPRRREHSDEDILLARATQDAHGRAGATYRSLTEILAGQPARPHPSAAP